jgi:hypothetical protein
VITGFNTDIEYNGVTYHVQTEDKGVETPLILSLVYDRGTILASKRSPYNDLLNGDFNEKELAERLHKQHKLICAAVKAGRIEDLKRMTMKESAAKKNGLIAQKELKKSFKAPPEKQPEEIPRPQFLDETPAAAVTAAATAPPEKIEANPFAVSDEAVVEIPISVLDEMIIEEVEIVEEELILPIEAVEIIKDFAEIQFPEEDKLTVELLNSPTFKGGERKTLSILVSNGREESGIPGAHVMVKVLGSAFRPLIFHAKTDSNGVAIVHLQLPQFKSGRAAILVKALSGGEEVELRRVIQHN